MISLCNLLANNDVRIQRETITTIQDIKDRFHVAEKTVKKLVKRGAVPEPETVVIGTRRFRYFSEEWAHLFETVLKTTHQKRS